MKKDFAHAVGKSAMGVNLSYIVINTKNVESMPEKVKTAATMSQENRIEILVNSSGVVSHSDYLDMSEQEYDSIMDINAKGTFFMYHAAAKYIIENRIKGQVPGIKGNAKYITVRYLSNEVIRCMKFISLPTPTKIK